MVLLVELQFLRGLVDSRVLDFDVHDLELIVADAVAQVVLVALVVGEAEVEGGEAVFELLLEVGVLVASSQTLLELELVLLVVLGDELFGGGLAVVPLLLGREGEVLTEAVALAAVAVEPLD